MSPIWIISGVLLVCFVLFLYRKGIKEQTSITKPDFAGVWQKDSRFRRISYLIIFALIAIYYAKRFIDLKERISLGNLKGALPFLLVAMLPFVWYLFASNHSYIHFWFTYRELVIFF